MPLKLLPSELFVWLRKTSECVKVEIFLMGCICSKGGSTDEDHGKEKQLKSNKSSRQLGASLRKEEVIVDGDGGGNEATVRLIENRGSTQISDDDNEEKGSKLQIEKSQSTIERPSLSRISNFSNGEKGAQVVAGWPSWLTSVAGEAINGWLPRKAESFEKLDKIGQGTYSSVYRARDLETCKMVALKKVRFANMDPESVRFMAREIMILRRLDHPNVMKLEGLITSRVSGSLYLIFEYMEHDLAGLAANPVIKFTEAQIKCFMRQLLLGLEHCHILGVLHRDIKGSNLLIDNNGNLKIGDFGLATFLRPHQKQPLTSRVVTLWYRPPELLLGSTDYGVSVDLWSSGCILAELFAGKPIMPGRTEVEQLHKIFKLCGSPSEEYWKRSRLPHATLFKPQHPYKRCVSETFKDFPSSALALLDVLLAIEPNSRGTASSALQNEFFTTNPLPCDPSSLPKYPPSKEFDAKIRDEEGRRQRAGLGVGREHETARKGFKESKAVPAPDANAELQASILKRQAQANPKSVSEKFNPEEDSGSGFPIEPPKELPLHVHSHSSQSMHPSVFGSSRNMNMNKGKESKIQRSFIQCGAAQLSRFSNSVAAQDGSRRFGIGGGGGDASSMNSDWSGQRYKNGKYNHLDGGESSGKHEWSQHCPNMVKSSKVKRDESIASGKESTMNRIHYSGPLMPPGGNLDQMLKEHERQIQQAVRKAHGDKTKAKTAYSDNGQYESLLHHGRNGR